MSLEQVMDAIQNLSQADREALLDRIDQWMNASAAPKTEDAIRAVAAVERTWASIKVDPPLAQWIAQDAELEYEPG